MWGIGVRGFEEAPHQKLERKDEGQKTIEKNMWSDIYGTITRVPWVA